MEDLYRIGFKIRHFLNHPGRVIVVCLFIFIISLFLNGSLWRVLGLYRDRVVIADQIQNMTKQSSILDVQIKQAKDPAFIERQARDKLDLVDEKDLIFVFSE